MIVDDSEDVRGTTRTILEEEGYLVDVASNGIEALKRIPVLPRPAVLLLDLMMPVMDGMTLLAELERRKELVGIQVVVMTAASASVETSTLPYPLLRKPFALAALLEIVAMYLPSRAGGAGEGIATDGRAATKLTTQG